MEDKNFWDIESCEGIVCDSRIDFIESILGYKLPQLYIKLIKSCDGGAPKKDEFKYYNNYRGKISMSCIGSFLQLNDNDSLSFFGYFSDPPEFFPQGLVAFADTGGGDLICFDYRQDKDNLDPPIVYWFHEVAGTGKDVSFIAKNFEEFIGMLYLDEYEH
jgi:hypothetical protein